MGQLKLFIIISVLINITASKSYSQVLNSVYEHYIRLGDSTASEKNYKIAINFYNEAFKNEKYSEHSYYTLAKFYAKDGQLKPIHKIIRDLYQSKYENIGRVLSDSNFIHFRENKKSKRLITKIKKYNILINGEKDNEIHMIFVEMRKRDQQDRKILDSLFKLDSDNEKLIGDVSERIRTADSLNMDIFLNLIETKGFPGKNNLSEEDQITSFLLFQHARTDIQKEYLPKIKKALKKGFFPKYQYAYLLDRILVNSNKKQLYGTQLFYDANEKEQKMLPVQNENKLEERRRVMGLTTSDSYLNSVNNKD